MKQPSKERGCDGKANLGSAWAIYAQELANKHRKTYAVYRCQHCGGTHLTTKIDNMPKYKPVLAIVGPDRKEAE